MFLHAGVLPPLKNKPHLARPFSFRGRNLAAGTLILDGDEYLIEWDADERVWIVAKQTGEPEIYCSRPDSCTCWGHKRWGWCKHAESLAELVLEWKKMQKQLDTVPAIG